MPAAHQERSRHPQKNRSHPARKDRPPAPAEMPNASEMGHPRHRHRHAEGETHNTSEKPVPPGGIDGTRTRSDNAASSAPRET